MHPLIIVEEEEEIKINKFRFPRGQSLFIQDGISKHNLVSNGESSCWSDYQMLKLSATMFTYTRNIITKTRLFKYIENFTTKKKEYFQIKNSDIFHISAQNIDCGYPLELREVVLTSTHSLCF